MTLNAIWPRILPAKAVSREHGGQDPQANRSHPELLQVRFENFTLNEPLATSIRDNHF
jgi:hypothetical protein